MDFQPAWECGDDGDDSGGDSGGDSGDGSSGGSGSGNGSGGDRGVLEPTVCPFGASARVGIVE